MYGDKRHTTPKCLKKYEGKELPLDNFSRKLDERAVMLTKDKKVKCWRDTVPKIADTKNDIADDILKNAPQENDVSGYHNVNAADKKMIAEKLEMISGRKFCNISENQFKVLLNIPDDESKTQWAFENLQVEGGYSPNYEFDDETDFIIASDDAQSLAGKDQGFTADDTEQETMETSDDNSHPARDPAEGEETEAENMIENSEDQEFSDADLVDGYM